MSSEELCLRCNYAYATTIDDNMPVCDGCNKNINKEPTRKCPVDKEEMNKVLIKNIMIDKCPKCNGIWLDGDEVNLLGKVATGAFKSSWTSHENDEKENGKFWKGFVVGAILS